MKRRGRLAAAVLLLSACAALAFGQAPGDIREGLATKGFSEAWIRSFGERWDALQARLRLPEETVGAVLRLFEPEWLPEDPAEAASALHETARQAEIRRRRGEPMWRVAARLEYALRQRDPSAEGAARVLGNDRGAAAGTSGASRLAEWRSARQRSERGAESRSRPASGPGPIASDQAGDEGSDTAGTSAGADLPASVSGDGHSGGSQVGAQGGGRAGGGQADGGKAGAGGSADGSSGSRNGP